MMNEDKIKELMAGKLKGEIGMTIKNREAIVEQLTAMLIQFDKDANTFYQTDVYLYYDK